MTGLRGNPQTPDPPSLSVLDRCPHCRIAKPYLPQVWTGTTTPTGNFPTREWGVYRCAHCGGLVTAAGEGNARFNPRYPAYIFPSPQSVSDKIPATAYRYLQQAVDTLHAPDAAAVMAGSAVDAMLKEKGYTEGSLYARIGKSVEDHVLTQGMADWAHSVRLTSNQPRHADVDQPHVTLAEAELSVEFAKALGEFLFVLPSRVEAALQKAQSKPTT